MQYLQAYKKLKSQERNVEYLHSQEGGEYYRTALDRIQSGIRIEERFLLQHRQQLINEINEALAHQHDESEKLEQEARSLGPDSYLAALARHTRKVEEQDADLNAWLLKYFSEF